MSSNKLEFVATLGSPSGDAPTPQEDNNQEQQHEEEDYISVTAVEAAGGADGPPPEEPQVLYQIDIELDNKRKISVRVHEGEELEECLRELQEREGISTQNISQIQEMIQQ